MHTNLHTNLHSNLPQGHFNHTDNGLPTTHTSTVAGGEEQNIHWLSCRIWQPHTLDDLRAMGITLTGESKGHYIECVLPRGWKVTASDVSPYQSHLLDQDGKLRARLYYQPGSAGGGMEMCLEDGR
jgi:hypothetical protein